MHNTSNVPIPERLHSRPMWHGFPIPYTTMINDGQPDFRTIDHLKVWACMNEYLCGVCGQSLDGCWIYFIGGEKSMGNRIFIDPGMHEECAYYAAKVCPYLAGTKREYSTQESKTEQSDDIALVTKIDQPRPKRMGILKTLDYKVINDRHMRLCKADKKHSIDWSAMPESR